MSQKEKSSTSLNYRKRGGKKHSKYIYTVVNELSEIFDIPRTKLQTIVEAIFAEIGFQVSQGNEIRIQGFGSFFPYLLPASKRNAAYFSSKNLPHCYRLHFKPYGNINEIVDEGLKSLERTK